MYRTAFPYVVYAVPSVLPISTANARTQLKLGSDVDAALDAELTVMINAAVASAERYIKRDLITRTYNTFRDRFYGDIILRRNPVQSITSVQYYKGGVLTTVSSSLYYVTVEPDGFSRICLVDGQSWPGDVDARNQAIVIQFKCGYGDAAASVPDAIRQGILCHVAQLWTHRGDNDFPEGKAASAAPDADIPAIARALYNQYRILEIS